jgi:hypothetical protein
MDRGGKIKIRKKQIKQNHKSQIKLKLARGHFAYEEKGIPI